MPKERAPLPIKSSRGGCAARHTERVATNGLRSEGNLKIMGIRRLFGCKAEKRSASHFILIAVWIYFAVTMTAGMGS